jgi:hypothetical protein
MILTMKPTKTLIAPRRKEGNVLFSFLGALCAFAREIFLRALRALLGKDLWGNGLRNE